MLRAAVLITSLALVAFVQPNLSSNLGGLVALTVAALCVAVVAVSLTGTASPSVSYAVSLREVARRPQYRRLSDPDAAGRPRPRAPGTA